MEWWTIIWVAVACSDLYKNVMEDGLQHLDIYWINNLGVGHEFSSWHYPFIKHIKHFKIGIHLTEWQAISWVAVIDSNSITKIVHNF